jgi:hypothetical protein
MFSISKPKQSRALLNQILGEPGLPEVIRSLTPSVLSKLIEHIGLEDSAEVISLASSEQIKQLFDIDLWRQEKPGKEETFNTDQFGVWLSVLLEMGASFAVSKVMDMDEDFLVMALAHQILVIDIDQLSTKMSHAFRPSRADNEMIEKALECGLSHEFEEFRVFSKDYRSWDSVLTLLTELDTQNYDMLKSILERCQYLSEEYIEDNGGLFNVLTSEEQIETDVAYEREQRREKEGFVSPSTAGSFLALIRITNLDELIEAGTHDPVTSSYFKNFSVKDHDIEHQSSGNAEPDSKKILSILEEARVINEPQNRLLLGLTSDTRENVKYSVLRNALLTLKDTDPKLYTKCMRELNYLANVLISGCSFSGRAFRPAEAAEATLTTCNLGLEYNPEALNDHNILKMFRVGWSILFQDVAGHAAKNLVRMLPQFTLLGDHWIKIQIDELIMSLTIVIAKGKPWEIREKLDFLETVMDSSDVLTIKHFLDEFPTGIPTLGPDFIYSRKQIEQIHLFLKIRNLCE